MDNRGTDRILTQGCRASHERGAEPAAPEQVHVQVRHALARVLTLVNDQPVAFVLDPLTAGAGSPA